MKTPDWLKTILFFVVIQGVIYLGAFSLAIKPFTLGLCIALVLVVIGLLIWAFFERW